MTTTPPNATPSTAYATLIEPATLRIQRLLPGPLERVWAHLTESELRRRWLASGDMPQRVGGAFELVWRNDELTSPPGPRPEGFGEEHRMASQITAMSPHARLAFTWQGGGEVTIELTPQGDQVLLTLTHSRVSDPSMLHKVGAGWHTHLDLLASDLAGTPPAPFWETWSSLRAEYAQRW